MLKFNATALTNSNLSGSAGISNANLANPTTTLGSSTLTLGATTTDIAGLTSLVIDTLQLMVKQCQQLLVIQILLYRSRQQLFSCTVRL